MEESKEKLLKAIRHYQDSLERHTKTGNGEKLLHAIEKLSRLPIKVCHLEETGIGRTVNGLKKVEGKVGEKARNLVDQWKSMVKGEEDAEQERMGKEQREIPAAEGNNHIENEAMDEDLDPDSLQICDEEEQSNNVKPRNKEADYTSHKNFTNTSKDNYDSTDSRKSLNKRNRSRDKQDKKLKPSHSSDHSGENSSDSEPETNHSSKKPKHGRDSLEKSKKSSHSSHRHSSDSESQSDSDTDTSESEPDSSPSRKKSRKSSRRNSSASRSSSDSDNSSEDDSASERDSKNKYKHHSDKKIKKHHPSDSNESDSDTETREKYGKSKGKSDKEKETSKRHGKSGSESDKDRQSKSRDSHNYSKSKERSHDSKDRQSNAKESKHEKSYKEKELISKKYSPSSKSKSKHEESEFKHKQDSKKPEKSKSKSDSDRDTKKSSKSDKYKESNGHSDSNTSSKSLKDKESSRNETKRVRESSADRERKKHKGSDSRESKSKSHGSSSLSKSKDRENSDLKKETEHKEKEKDKKERAEGDKPKRDSASGSKNTKDKDKSKTNSTSVSSSSKPKITPKQFPIIIDSESGASFADVLGMLEAPVFNKNKKKSGGTIGSQDKTSSERSSSSDKGDKSSRNSAGASTSTGGASSSKDTSEVPKLLKDPGDLEPLDINMTSLLPSITPNYRPLSMPLDNNQHRKLWSDDEALTRVINAKHQRTKVYSGNKVTYTKVPTLFDLCSRILQDNIDALEYTGGVPYTILKPIIEKANPDQLFQLEFHNPYLIEDSDELWLLHCQKEFRTKKREEMESWRDMYMRCLDEREAKLKALTANIKQSQDVKVPVRTTKLAYLDTAVKPPRNIAKKQARNGTAVDNKRPSQTPTERLNQLAKAGEAGKVAVPNPGKAASERSSSSNHSHSSHFKPKKAPLMAKTLSLLKNRFGRR